jgi:hypothetical protein
MQKTTGTQITTINFVGPTFESGAWTADEVETWGESLVDDFAAGHRGNEGDDGYTAVYGEAQTFEYEVPGLRVVALLAGGELMTVWTIEKSLPAALRIEKAADREQPVTITYTRADGTETVRTIEPTGLKVTKAGDTLVLAMDRLSGEKRSFRLDRVSAYTVHRTRRTVRTGVPAPTKADLWAQFQAERTVGEYAVEVTTPAVERPGVQVQNWDGTSKTITAEAYDELTAARDPREPKAADEALAAVVRRALSGPLPEAGTEADGDLMRRLDEAARATV